MQTSLQETGELMQDREIENYYVQEV